jgi:hypothetical protein
MTSQTNGWQDADVDRLRVLAAAVMPASMKFDVPGADDAKIFDQVLLEAGHDRESIGEALNLLDSVAGGSFVAVSARERAVIIEAFRRTYPDHALRLAGAVFRAYYRDDRVMTALGMEPRPPFPKGFEVEQGDWSLLEPVRKGPLKYRQAP